MSKISSLPRRRLMAGIVAAAGSAGAGLAGQSAAAKEAASAEGTPHKVVYQINRAEPEYQLAILNSISAMLKKYVDDVSISVVVWGPGIHLLAKKPRRPVPKTHQQRVRG